MECYGPFNSKLSFEPWQWLQIIHSTLKRFVKTYYARDFTDQEKINLKFEL